MSTGDSSRNLAKAVDDPEFPKVLEKKLREREMEENWKRRIQEGQATYSVRAKDVAVYSVTDPLLGPEFDHSHNTLVRTPRIIAAAKSKDPVQLKKLAEKIKKEGGFLERYEGVGEERLKHSFDFEHPELGGWVILQAKGRPIDPKNGEYLEEMICGDGHFYIPPDIDNAPLTAPLPIGPNDSRFSVGEKMVEAIVADPACAVWIADINSAQGAHKMGVASSIENYLFALIHELNKTRNHKIKYGVAAIATTMGVREADGEQLFEQPLCNLASIYLHIRHGIGQIVGEQINRTISCKNEQDEPCEVMVNWPIVVLEIPVPRSDESAPGVESEEEGERK